MAVRIRENGQIFCAALNDELIGDIYVDDELHYFLSVEIKILVTTENNYHLKNGGEWWWKGIEPSSVKIDPFYYQPYRLEDGVTWL